MSPTMTVRLVDSSVKAAVVMFVVLPASGNRQNQDRTYALEIPCPSFLKPHARHS